MQKQLECFNGKKQQYIIYTYQLKDAYTDLEAL